ncbi:hypothetical protein IQ259_24445 [Fortiea sp. LEGE XX443]|nr:hypothetical protein [Fortiea sp. LEGE XX443]MBE9008123.1 hypothetical protein [Fortiea sp. LEGE XX443]
MLPIITASAFWLVIANSVDNSAFSQQPTPDVQRNIRYACQEQNLETLTTRLLQDLPSYANRASQRARRRKRSSDIYSYMVLAGRPEFQPLPLNPAGDTIDKQKSSETGVEQVFFTTLERQYINNKAIELQEFHWLLLTKDQNGWYLVMMFTQTASSAKQKLPTPPRDSSNGTVAQGVKTWLRDCQAGKRVR